MQGRRQGYGGVAARDDRVCRTSSLYHVLCVVDGSGAAKARVIHGVRATNLDRNWSANVVDSKKVHDHTSFDNDWRFRTLVWSCSTFTERDCLLQSVIVGDLRFFTGGNLHGNLWGSLIQPPELLLLT